MPVVVFLVTLRYWLFQRRVFT